jgi:hypothetical protein
LRLDFSPRIDLALPECQQVLWHLSAFTEPVSENEDIFCHQSNDRLLKCMVEFNKTQLVISDNKETTGSFKRWPSQQFEDPTPSGNGPFFDGSRSRMF